MPRVPIDASVVILTVLAAAFAVVAYLRVVPSLAFPVIAGWLVLLFYSE